MWVETTMWVAVTTLHDRASHPRLISEARARLVSSGLASVAAVAGDPTMVVSAGDLSSKWVMVTFRWESH